MNLHNETGDNSGDVNKPYDLTMIYAISESNPEFLDKLLLMFTDTVKKDLETAITRADEGDWSEVGQMVHKMKASLNHFGVKGIKDIIATLEHPGNTPPEKLKELIAELEQIINSVFLNLKEEFPATFNA
jgi:HPt (histidine-containing phosphotransfer) domain-containing protein